MRIPHVRIGGRLPTSEDNQARNKDTSKVDAVQTVEEEEQQYNHAVFFSQLDPPLFSAEMKRPTSQPETLLDVNFN